MFEDKSRMSMQLNLSQTHHACVANKCDTSDLIYLKDCLKETGTHRNFVKQKNVEHHPVHASLLSNSKCNISRCFVEHVTASDKLVLHVAGLYKCCSIGPITCSDQ